MVSKTKVYKSMDEQSLQRLYEFLERWGTLSGDLEEAYRVGGKSAQEFQKEIDKLTKSYKKQQTTYDQLKRVMTELDDSIEELAASTDKTTAAERAAEIAVKRKMKADLAAEAAVKAAAESMRTVTKDGLNKAAQGMGQFVKSLQGDASGTQLASELMVAGIEIAGTAAKGAGKTIGALGETMMAGSLAAGQFAPAVFLVGGALKIFGEVTGATAENMTKLAKFGVEVLAKEVEKTYKAFNQMSSSGALFSDGMTGMRVAAKNAGLTVEQMSNVVKASSNSIAAAGMGVTDGVKMLGRVGDAMKRSGAQEQLLKLGYGFEEQVELMADVTRQMRLTGKTVSDQNVMRATQQYAENLRLIAGITGEDAKKKMQQAEEESKELAFRQALASKGIEEQQAIIAAMSTLSEVDRKNLKDRVIFNGAVINETGAIFESQVKGARDRGKELYEAFQSGTLTAKRAAELNAKYGEEQNKSIIAMRAMGRAAYAVPEMKEYGQTLSKQIDINNQYTKSAVANSEANLNQKDAQDDLTKGVISAEQAAQDLKVALQETLTPAIKDFAKVSGSMLQVVKDALKDLGYGADGKKTTKEITPAEQAAKDKAAKVKELQEKENLTGFAKSTGFFDTAEIKKAKQEQADAANLAQQQNRYAKVLENLEKQALQKAQTQANIEKYGYFGRAGHEDVELTPQQRDEARRVAIEQLRKQGEQAEKQGGITSRTSTGGVTKFTSDEVKQLIEEAIQKTPKHAEGGDISSGKMGIVGETGPELVGGPASVLSRVDTEKLMVVLDAMREMKGTRFGENDFDWQVGMQAERWDTLRERVKGFENFSKEQVEAVLKSRPEMKDMAAARNAIMEAEAYDEGGRIGPDDIGLVGEKGPEIVSTDDEAIKYLQDQIAKINQMIKNTGVKYGEFNGSSIAYSGEIGGSDFKFRPGVMKDFNVTAGMSPTSMKGAQGVLEHYLEQISGKDEGTKATPETYKMLADQAVKMADVFGQVEQLSDQNIPTEKLMDILNAFNLKSGMSGVDKSAEGYDDAQGFIKEKLKGFENFDKESIETMIRQRQGDEERDKNTSLDAVPISDASEEMREKFSSMLSEKFDEMIDVMKQNADHTARVAHNTN